MAEDFDLSLFRDVAPEAKRYGQKSGGQTQA
jgi:hypothetical protein